MPCKQHRGNEVIGDALEDALSKKINAEVVVIIVSPDGVRTIEGLTSQVKKSIFIEHVTFTTTLGEKKEIFGFISQDTRLKRILCHLYECGPGIAFNVTKTIGEAFKLLSTKNQERKQNAFASVFSERDQVPGQLFRCQVHRKDVVPDKVIGAGQFGQVYLAMYKGATKVAVKTVRLAASANDKDDFVAEAEVMRKLVHENLVQLVGVAVQQRPWLCVIEYVWRKKVIPSDMPLRFWSRKKKNNYAEVVRCPAPFMNEGQRIVQAFSRNGSPATSRHLLTGAQYNMG